MKKLLLTLAFVFAAVAISFAQPRAIGVRLYPSIIYSSFDVSYQHTINSNGDFLQGDLGLLVGDSSVGAEFSGSYNRIIISPNWTASGTWNVYAGGGASVGIVNTYSSFSFISSSTSLITGILGQAGLEYNFEFPLQLAIDVRPTIYFYKREFYFGGLIPIPTLSIRYNF